MIPSPSIFKAYDIRGIVGTTLTHDIVASIGRAIGSDAKSLHQKSIVIGRDGRLSGADFLEALARGILATGLDVIDIGHAAGVDHVGLITPKIAEGN